MNDIRVKSEEHLLCSWADCEAPADREVRAQWTIFDFVDYPACIAHGSVMFEVLERRRVDGEFPQDVWVVYYEEHR